jgi:glycosyltransferase involved in cell wall biosynthesis
MPPLTIIITFYDETAYLDMAVSSVSGQGIDEIELIIVNDNPARFGPDYFEGLGLPDGTRVLHHDVNKGLAAARNTGIDAARG